MSKDERSQYYWRHFWRDIWCYMKKERKRKKKRVNYYYKYYVDTNSQYFFVSHLTYYKNFTNKPFGCGPSAVPFSLHRPVYEQKPFCAISIWLESSRSIKLHPFIIRAFWMRSVCAAQTESAHFKLELNAAKHTHTQSPQITHSQTNKRAIHDKTHKTCHKCIANGRGEQTALLFPPMQGFKTQQV